MREKITKLIQSDNTDDWLIAYELIIKEYGSFYAFPRNKNYLYIEEDHMGRKKLFRSIYRTNSYSYPPKYAQL